MLTKMGWIAILAVAMSAAVPAKAAVLANIGDKALSDEQVKNDYEMITGDQKKAINEDPATRRNLVDNAINTEILVLAARKADMDKDDEYQRALERFQKNYLAQRFMSKAIEPKLGKGELKKYFEDNRGFFDSTQACAHHVLVTDEAEAKEVLAKAKAKGAKFEDLAKKYSIDPTVQENKGNLGCFTRDRMVPEFTNAVFAMRKGEVKGPIHTMYGYHVIMLDSVKPGKVPGFEEIEQRVKETYRLKVLTELLQDLRTKSGVRVNEEEVRKFKL